jgi:hypothetical protein
VTAPTRKAIAVKGKDADPIFTIVFLLFSSGTSMV